MGAIATTEGTWPKIEDLIAGSTLEIPRALQKDLAQRYLERGGKYATDKIDEESGLPINSCMERYNIQEMYEELVDAVFNVLVYFKRFPERKLVATQLLSLLLKTVQIGNQEAAHAHVSREDVGDSVPPAAEGSGEQSGSRSDGERQADEGTAERNDADNGSEGAVSNGSGEES